MKRTFYLLMGLGLFLNFVTAQEKPTVSFTFDDGSIGDRPGYVFEEWNGLLLRKLEDAGLKTVLFVAGKNKEWKRGKHLLKSWDDAGHGIANHTWNHYNFNDPKNTVALFKTEVLRTDSLIDGYKNYTKLFRYPYLKEGNTPEKVLAFRSCLDSVGYRNGYVTIDASDWYIDGRLVKALQKNPQMDLAPYREFYLKHIFERACFYEQLSYELNGRHIKPKLRIKA